MSVNCKFIIDYRCQCQNCIVMESVEESYCCQGKKTVFAKMEELSSEPDSRELNCITEHPRFQSVCLNPWSLEMAYMYLQADGYIESAMPTEA